MPCSDLGRAPVKLYTYFRSTSSYRVRIALNIKGVRYESSFVHLLRNGGEQHSAAYRAINPQGRLPSLVLDSGAILTQSPAILEYIEETWPTPPLLPDEPADRAHVRAVAAIVGCDIHPLHNIGPLTYIRQAFGQDETAVSGWIAHWIGEGLSAVDALIGDEGWCFGSRPGMADVYLVPQLFAARRFSVDLKPFRRIRRVEALAAAHAAFVMASPPQQPDAER
jgi:maleylacetoacetate isomerase